MHGRSQVSQVICSGRLFLLPCIHYIVATNVARRKPGLLSPCVRLSDQVFWTVQAPRPGPPPPPPTCAGGHRPTQGSRLPLLPPPPLRTPLPTPPRLRPPPCLPLFPSPPPPLPPLRAPPPTPPRLPPPPRLWPPPYHLWPPPRRPPPPLRLRCALPSFVQCFRAGIQNAHMWIVCSSRADR